jgi:hypothetical protein
LNANNIFDERRNKNLLPRESRKTRASSIGLANAFFARGSSPPLKKKKKKPKKEE